jgi:peroxiredoxin
MKKLIVQISSLLLVLVLATAMTAPENGYEIGDIATDFSLKNVDGEMVSLSDYPDAKGYIVIFTCNECPYAKLYEDRINALNVKYESQGYPVIAIMPNDPAMQPGDGFENMQARAESKGFTFPYLIDEGQTIFPQYGASKTPHVFLLNQDRVVKYIGAVDNNPKNAASADVKYVENAIAALEAGEDPSPDYTKAVGCGIKAKR